MNGPLISPAESKKQRDFLRIAIWLAILLPCSLAQASVYAAPSLEDFTIRRWTSMEGLPQDVVTTLLQDRDGYIWIGTNAGLARFDGTHFVVYNQRNAPSLKSDAILSLAQSADGVLWIGTSGGGLNRLKDGHVLPAPQGADLLGKNIYALYVGRDGVLWTGSELGLGTMSGNTFHLLEVNAAIPKVAVYSITQDRDGSIWFATYGRGIGVLTGNYARLWTSRSDGLPDDRALIVAQDKDSGLLVSTFGGALSEFRAGKFFPVSQVTGQARNKGIWAIARLPGGQLVAGSFGAGIGLLENGVLSFPARSGQFHSSTIWSLLVDREGSLWAGSSEGLLQIRQLPLRTLTKKDGLPADNITSVYALGGSDLLVGTDAGLVRYNPEKKAGKRLLSADVSAITKDDNGWWFGTQTGELWHTNTVFASAKRLAVPWGSAPIHSLFALASRGYPPGRKLWVGTRGKGLYTCDISNGHFACTTEPELADKTVVAIVQRQNQEVWVGAREGLYRYAHDGWRQFGKADGLASENIASLKEDDTGALWMGTEKGGLGRYKDGRFTWLTTSQGLPDDSVFSILDHGDALWLGTTKGIFTLKKAAFDAVSQQPLDISKYGLQDGLLSTECTEDTPNAAAGTGNGDLWFATIKGLVQIPEEHTKTANPPPRLKIEAVRLDGAEVEPPGPSVVVPPGTRHLQVIYTALSYVAAEQQVFRYRLEGFEKDWVEAGPARFASYTNLPHGHYRLVLEAQSGRGSWNTQGTSLPILVQPHFYETRWFIAASTLALVCIAVALYLVRMGYLHRQFAAVLAERSRSALAQQEVLLKNTAVLTEINTSVRDSLFRVATGVELREVMQHLLSNALQQFDARYACIYLYEKSEQVLDRCFSASPAAKLSALEEAPLQLNAENFKLHRLLKENKEPLLLDLRKHEDAQLLWPDAPQTIASQGAIFLLCIPLFARQKDLGVLALSLPPGFTSHLSLEVQNLAESVGSLASMALESHRLSLQARYAAVAEERSRLSEEMHDGLQQMFTAISLQIGAIQRAARHALSPMELEPQLERTAQIADQGLRELRRAVQALRDSALSTAPLDQDELVDLLANLCRSADSEEVLCRLKLSGDLRLPCSHKLNELYRIAQEGVTNAVKHAQARNVEVCLKQDGMQLVLNVMDDGMGFSPDSPAAKGNGLRNLGLRAVRLEASLKIVSSNSGTTLTLNVPDVKVFQ